jgi:hypothetical protein
MSSIGSLGKQQLALQLNRPFCAAVRFLIVHKYLALISDLSPLPLVEDRGRIFVVHFAACALRTVLCSPKVSKHPNRLRDGFVFP